MEPIRRRTALLLACLFVPLLASCGDDSILDLDERVELELFTEIEEVPGGAVSYRQRASVILSPSLSESDLDLITRVRIIDQFDQDWVLSEDPEFVAGDRGWELVAERSANRGFRTGPWSLRMVVEEQGVFDMGHAQRFAEVGSPGISEAGVTAEGVVQLRWSLPAQILDWTAEVVRRTPDGETVLNQVAGQGRGGGAVSAGFDVDPESFDGPDEELVYRLVLVNSVSRRVVSDVLVPPS